MVTVGFSQCIREHFRSSELNQLQYLLIMRSLIATCVFLVVVANAAKENLRIKRQAYELPDGADIIVGPTLATFECVRSGYYADVDNDCQVFHVCNELTYASGRKVMQQYSFFCPNLTIFNQLTLTCGYPEESVPCINAPDFFYVNDNIGIEQAEFLSEGDVERASQLIPGTNKRPGTAAAASAAAAASRK
ncbi:uncharacterized protein LOC135399380 [Ornithodoros turicata]|uniref:uncharacterized protein LOC135399380 n=1 Tax=Ornithodoros turicata TaxID=34597 RepID=UPI003138CC47